MILEVLIFHPGCGGSCPGDGGSSPGDGGSSRSLGPGGAEPGATPSSFSGDGPHPSPCDLGSGPSCSTTLVHTPFLGQVFQVS